jgi:hypothetical protein
LLLSVSPLLVLEIIRKDFVSKKCHFSPHSLILIRQFSFF